MLKTLKAPTLMEWKKNIPYDSKIWKEEKGGRIEMKRRKNKI